MAEHTEPNSETLDEERAEAHASHGAPQRPTAEEAQAAASAEADVDDRVRSHYQDMAEKGANVKGEGQVP